MQTTLGIVTLKRRWFGCSCLQSTNGCLVDDVLGLSGYLSQLLQRRACLFSSDVSFGRTREYLIESFAVTISDESIRKCVEYHARQMADWQEHDTAIRQSFKSASGEVEFLVDAGKVNTIEEKWKDLKIATLQKRERGEPAEVEAWAERILPKPSARVAFASIVECKQFRRNWRAWSKKLGVRSPRDIHALGDGAEWIWNSVHRQFRGCRETLDIYHALEHIADAGKSLYGLQTPEADEFLERGRALLLEKGWNGVTELIAHEIDKDDTQDRRQTLDKMLSYFCKHVRRLNYADNLEQGLAIGSGAVEGWAKTMGLRLKARGARWRKTNAISMAAMCCVRNTEQWETYWTSA